MTIRSGNSVLLWTAAVLLSSASLSLGTPLPQSSSSGLKSYSGYSVLRTDPITREDLAKALMVLDGMYGIHFWKYPLVNRSSDILTSPTQRAKIRAMLDTLGLGHNVMIEDVEDLLKGENQHQHQEDVVVLYDDHKNNNEQTIERAQPANAFFQRYQRYDAIMNFARNLANEDSRVTYERIGTSTEGREIGLVTISSGGSGSKPAIWIDGGMHAREWISPATATYIMNKLVKDPNSKSLLDMFDFYIVPMINVDGYEFTHTGDRMWRKTRSKHSGTSNYGRCVGVDPNRNWGFHWAEQGSSNDPCSDIFHGPRAFSEPETLNVARAIKARANQIKMYLTFHSYSQLWLVPYGYSRYSKPADYNELMRMGNVGKRALEATYGTTYRIGTAPDLLYPAAGGSDDWAKGGAGIKYSYCLELRDTGRYGFILPSNQIVPTGEETFNGVAATAKELYRTLKKQGSKGPYVNAEVAMNSPNGGNELNDDDIDWLAQ